MLAVPCLIMDTQHETKDAAAISHVGTSAPAPSSASVSRMHSPPGNTVFHYRAAAAANSCPHLKTPPTTSTH